MKGKKKTYVLDASVVITDPDIFDKLGMSEMIIPTASVKDIDGVKRDPDPDEPRARQPGRWQGSLTIWAVIRTSRRKPGQRGFHCENMQQMSSH